MEFNRGRNPKPQVRGKNPGRKTGTLSDKAHRYEPFSKRIARINVNPIRRTDAPYFVKDDQSHQSSYFEHALLEWTNLNLSQNFIDFTRTIKGSYESLPQLIHHADFLIDTLEKHIRTHDAQSLEPLLNLLLHLARDLNQRFEKYFGRACFLLCELATAHHDIEIVELCFNTFAWLFKYFSRLLVVDLRPIYDLLAPVMGKKSQKHFVMRFAAEAFSYLIKRAAVTYERNKEPLLRIISYILKDLHSVVCDMERERYSESIIILIKESIKGVKREIHKTGIITFTVFVHRLVENLDQPNINVRSYHLISSLLQKLSPELEEHAYQQLMDILIGTLTNYCSQASCSKLGIIISLCKELISSERCLLSSNWADTYRLLSKLLRPEHSTIMNETQSTDVIRIAVAIYCRSPIEEMLSNKEMVYQLLCSRWEASFLGFCNSVSTQAPERVEDLILPVLQRYMNTRSVEHVTRTTLTLCHLIENESVPKGALLCPKEWQSLMTCRFEALLANAAEERPDVVWECFVYLRLMNSITFGDQFHQKVSQILQKVLDRATELLESGVKDSRTKFACTGAMEYLLQRGCVISHRWSFISASSRLFKAVPEFWETTSSFLQQYKEAVDFDGHSAVVLVNSLSQTLSSPSHQLRVRCLRTFRYLYLSTQCAIPPLLAKLEAIESIPKSLENVRLLSMEMRSVGTICKNSDLDLWLRQIIPYFCFGLLHVKLSKIWDDALFVLECVSGSEIKYKLPLEIIWSWLQHNAVSTTIDENSRAPVKGIEATFYSETKFTKLQEYFESHLKESLMFAPSCRSQALRVLDHLPYLAEKDSRRIVLIFLHAYKQNEGVKLNDESRGSHREVVPLKVEARWNRKDLKAFLHVFSQFRNLKDMYMSEELYKIALDILGNGDLSYQCAAMQVIQAWKIPAINDRSVYLKNLLSSTTYNDEILAVLSSDQQEGATNYDDKCQFHDVLLHLLYGRSIARDGSTSDAKDSRARRRNVISAVSRLGLGELDRFLNISLAKSRIYALNDVDSGSMYNIALKDLQNVHGTLKMIEDILITLGDKIIPLAPKLIDAVLRSADIIIRWSLGIEVQDERFVKARDSNLGKSLRRDTNTCIILVIEKCPNLSWSFHLPHIVAKLIVPKLNNLAVENVHSLSGTVKLLGSLFGLHEGATYLLNNFSGVLVHLMDCLLIPTIKLDVIHYILKSILIRLLQQADEHRVSEDEPENSDLAILPRLLSQVSHEIVIRLDRFLISCQEKEAIILGIEALLLVSNLSLIAEDAIKIINTLTFLLYKRSKIITDSIDNVLRVTRTLCQRNQKDMSTEDASNILRAIALHFSAQRNQVTRMLLCETLESLIDVHLSKFNNDGLKDVAKLCSMINTASRPGLKSSGEDLQINALSDSMQLLSEDNTTLQRELLMSNIIFHMRNSEDYIVRSHCVSVLRHFIDKAAEGDETKSGMRTYLKEILIPHLYRGLREKSEIKRAEFLALFSHIIQTCPGLHVITELCVLNFRNEEEASFFNNILHVQYHRRLRALRRLSVESKSGKIGSRNIKGFLLPLIQHFVFGPKEGSNNHNLAQEAISTIGSLVEWLEWDDCLAIFDSYLDQLQPNSPNLKYIVKILNTIATSLWIASNISEDRLRVDAQSRAAVCENRLLSTRLSITAQQAQSNTKYSSDKRVKIMLCFLRNTDQEIANRISVAVSAIRIILISSVLDTPVLLPSILSNLTRILKSRDQDSRNMARNSLAEIVLLLGPKYFSFMLKELQAVLQRGYQLHVLGYTVHYLILSATSKFPPGAIDYCVHPIMKVILDDIFGKTGKDKDAEGYSNKMKEVKAKKSFDSVEQLLKLTGPSKLTEIIGPVKNLLLENLNLKSILDVEEVLRRVCLGFCHNQQYHNQETLLFCYEIFIESHRVDNGTAKINKYSRRATDTSVNHPQDKLPGNRNTTQLHKMRRFALDAMRNILYKSYHLQTAESVSGLLPVINEAITDNHDEVKMSGLRLLTTLAKIPSSQIDSDTATHIAEAVKIIKDSPATNTEIAQASIKLVATILRERSTVEVRDNDILVIVQKIQYDLQEPDRQGSAFNFMKAVLSRKVLAPEVYDVIDEIANIMVTNESTNTREQVRALYFQFIMEYPQSHSRFEKQISFLIRNLDYEYSFGRASVMEALHLLLSKVGEKLIQPILQQVFIPLVLANCNDKTNKCKEMAGELIKIVFKRADKQLIGNFATSLHGWLRDTAQEDLMCISLQCWDLFYKSGRSLDTPELITLCSQLQYILRSRRSSDGNEQGWKLLYYSLNLIATLVDILGDIMFRSILHDLWNAIFSQLVYPHAWVKLISAKLVGRVLQYNAQLRTRLQDQSTSLSSQQILKLNMKDLLYIAYRSFDVANGMLLTNFLAEQVTQNLVLISTACAADEGPVGEKTLVADNIRLQPSIVTSTDILNLCLTKAANMLPRHSSMVKAEHMHSQLAMLHYLESVIRLLPHAVTVRSLKSMLTPLYLITSSDTAASIIGDQSVQDAYATVMEKCNMIMDILRKEVNEEFLESLHEIRKETREKRDERRSKRKIEAINLPEKELLRKQKKHDLAKRRRRDKSLQARGKRRGW